jgi:hypothetical protein
LSNGVYTNRSSRKIELALFACILSGHTTLLVWSACVHSPTFHEVGHVPAGLCHWRYGLFELYRVNPPLPRMVATLPLLAMDVKTNWAGYTASWNGREEIPTGIRFAKANGKQVFHIYTVARLATIPFSLVGCCIVYFWARALWGHWGAVLSAILWSANPSVLGHGSLVMPDIPGAAVGLGAAFAFWRWLEHRRWSTAAICGALLGAAILCKTTFLLFILVWPVLWILCRIRATDETPCRLSARGKQVRPLAAKARLRPDAVVFCKSKYETALGAAQNSVGRRERGRAREAAMLLFMLLCLVYVVNLGYGFKESFVPLRQFKFQSQLLSGLSNTNEASLFGGSIFHATVLGHIPVPLPTEFLQGIDRQRADFERGAPSYLLGRWRSTGWWYYYLHAFAVKTPPGTLLILVLATWSALTQASSRSPSQLVLAACALSLLLLVSSQTGISNHFRYAFPVWPFVCVWCGQIAHWTSHNKLVQSLCILGLLSTLASAALCAPNWIAYYNVFAGGMPNGHNHLLGSNTGWGQDLLKLKEWVQQSGKGKPIRLATVGWIDPRQAEVEFTLPPIGPSKSRNQHNEASPRTGPNTRLAAKEPADYQGQFHSPEGFRTASSADVGPLPGLYVIDVNHLHGTHWPAPDGMGEWMHIDEELNFEYFRFFEPTDHIGHTLYVYVIDEKSANRVRRMLQLPSL